MSLPKLVFRIYPSSNKQFGIILYRSCATAASKKSETVLLTKKEEAHRFMLDCFKAVGAPEDNAKAITDHLIQADCLGQYSHGMNRLEKYMRLIQGGFCDPKAKPTIDKESCATALVNAHKGLGMVAGDFCLNLAIDKAKKVGFAVVACHGSNHFGLLQVYTAKAANKGCIGMCFTNSTPILAPTRARKAAIGTNPLSLGAPGKDENFVFDMATTAVSMGKIELMNRKGKPIPQGWAINTKGEMETNAAEVMKNKGLMPLGGAEETSGYKGYGLGMMVEILCGILGGGAYGPNIKGWGQDNQDSNLCHNFMIIDPEFFAPGFKCRLSNLLNCLRNLELLDPSKPIMLAGEFEQKHVALVEKRGALHYVENQHKTNAKLAKEFNVKSMVSYEGKL